MNGTVFVDWLSCSQFHEGGNLPIIHGGITVQFDRDGIARYERLRPEDCRGSWGTSVRVACNGSRVFLSGNVGRFGREDNLFNFGWEETVRCANRILADCGLPAFTGSFRKVSDEGRRLGARVSRIDVTTNFSAGSEAQAAAVIRWLGGQSVKRVKRGQAGNDSVWWANSRQMFKAYRKDVELVAHGAQVGSAGVVWAREKGVVRVEVELKRRLLNDLGLVDLDEITQARLEAAFFDQTEIMRRVDKSDDPDIIANVPAKVRMTVAAWLAGQDVKAILSNGTLYRHAAELRPYGIDILSPRNVCNFPVKVRVVELEPLRVPEWYSLKVVNS